MPTSVVASALAALLLCGVTASHGVWLNAAPTPSQQAAAASTSFDSISSLSRVAAISSASAIDETSFNNPISAPHAAAASSASSHSRSDAGQEIEKESFDSTHTDSLAFESTWHNWHQLTDQEAENVRLRAEIEAKKRRAAREAQRKAAKYAQEVDASIRRLGVDVSTLRPVEDLVAAFLSLPPSEQTDNVRHIAGMALSTFERRLDAWYDLSRSFYKHIEGALGAYSWKEYKKSRTEYKQRAEDVKSFKKRQQAYEFLLYNPNALSRLSDPSVRATIARSTMHRVSVRVIARSIERIGYDDSRSLSAWSAIVDETQKSIDEAKAKAKAKAKAATTQSTHIAAASSRANPVSSSTRPVPLIASTSERVKAPAASRPPAIAAFESRSSSRAAPSHSTSPVASTSRPTSAHASATPSSRRASDKSVATPLVVASRASVELRPTSSARRISASRSSARPLQVPAS